MEFLNKLLAGFIENFKAKNPTIYGCVIAGLAAVYVGLELSVSKGLFAGNEMIARVIQYIDVIMMTILGTKTAPFLKEYLDRVSPAEVSQPDSCWTSILDAFKMKNPMVFGIISTLLITFFVGTQYAIHFDIIPDGSVATVLKIAGYVDVAVLILLGSRTGKYIQDNPFQETPGSISKQSVKNKVLYYD